MEFSSLCRPGTHMTYVDGARQDNYIPDGTETRPHKSIQAGINAAHAQRTASGEQQVVWIAPWTEYNEQLTLYDAVHLYTPTQNGFWLEWDGSGDAVTMASGGWCEIWNLVWAVQNGSGRGLVVTSGGVSLYNVGVWTAHNEAVSISGTGAVVSAFTWMEADDHSCVHVGSGGRFKPTNFTDLYGEPGSHYDLVVDSGGTLQVCSSLFLENWRISNSGTTQYLNQASYLGNDSGVAGNSVKDALNNLSEITYGAGAPGTTPKKMGNIYIDTSGGNIYIAKGATSSSDWIKVN